MPISRSLFIPTEFIHLRTLLFLARSLRVTRSKHAAAQEAASPFEMSHLQTQFERSPAWGRLVRYLWTLSCSILWGCFAVERGEIVWLNKSMSALPWWITVTETNLLVKFVKAFLGFFYAFCISDTCKDFKIEGKQARSGDKQILSIIHSWCNTFQNTWQYLNFHAYICVLKWCGWFRRMDRSVLSLYSIFLCSVIDWKTHRLLAVAPSEYLNYLKARYFIRCLKSLERLLTEIPQNRSLWVELHSADS